MKANARTAHRGRRLRRGDAAQVGIGTMIIFIATILTAAVAAGVVIDTTNNLQEKAQRTGLESTEQVSNNLEITTIQGIADSAGTKLDALNITLRLSPGSKQVDLGQLIVRLSNETLVRQIAYTANGTGASFNATKLRDPDGSFTSTTPVMTAGDLVILNIGLGSSNVDLGVGTRKEVDVTLQPEIGARVQTSLRAPTSLVANEIVLLR